MIKTVCFFRVCARASVFGRRLQFVRFDQTNSRGRSLITLRPNALWPESVESVCAARFIRRTPLCNIQFHSLSPSTYTQLQRRNVLSISIYVSPTWFIRFIPGAANSSAIPQEIRRTASHFICTNQGVHLASLIACGWLTG